MPAQNEMVKTPEGWRRYGNTPEGKAALAALNRQRQAGINEIRAQNVRLARAIRHEWENKGSPKVSLRKSRKASRKNRKASRKSTRRA